MKTKIEEFLDCLDDYSFEEILEMFDLSTLEVMEVLFEGGLIDEELLNGLIGDDGTSDDYDR